MFFLKYQANEMLSHFVIFAHDHQQHGQLAVHTLKNPVYLLAVAKETLQGKAHSTSYSFFKTVNNFESCQFVESLIVVNLL